MNRYDFYYRQKVMEDELDNAFKAAEDSLVNFVVDQKLGRVDSPALEFGGVNSGFIVTLSSGVQVSVSPGTGYDDTGKRTATTAPILVSMDHVGNTATGLGGTPSGASLDPGAGFCRYAALFIVFDRALTDERIDGYGEHVWFNRGESFHFYVSAGPIKPFDTLGPADKPARVANCLLLADVKVKNVAGTVSIYDVSQLRYEKYINVTGVVGTNPKTLSAYHVREALKVLLDYYSNHVNGYDPHPASGVTWPGGTTWADGLAGAFGLSANVADALVNLTLDLKKSTDIAGTKRIGSKAQAGSLLNPTQVSVLSLTATTLEAQLTAIMDAINGRVFRGGDNGVGSLVPADASGKTLGDVSHLFDAYLRDLYVSGSLKSGLTPNANESYDLGATPSNKFRTIYTKDLSATGTVTSGNSVNSGVATTTNLAVTAICQTPLSIYSTDETKPLLDISAHYSANIENLSLLQRISSTNGFGVSPVLEQDCLGLVTRGAGCAYETDFIVNDDISTAVFNSAMAPWQLISTGGTLTAALGCSGQASLCATLDDAEIHNIIFGSLKGSLLVANSPSMMVAFSGNSSLGSINGGDIVVGFSAGSSYPSRQVYIKMYNSYIPGFAKYEMHIVAGYYDGSAHQTHDLYLQEGVTPPPNFPNEYMFVARIAILSSNVFYFSINDPSGLHCSHVMTYVGANTFHNAVYPNFVLEGDHKPTFTLPLAVNFHKATFSSLNPINQLP
jgi:hypothetical protein